MHCINNSVAILVSTVSLIQCIENRKPLLHSSDFIYYLFFRIEDQTEIFKYMAEIAYFLKIAFQIQASNDVIYQTSSMQE